MKRGGEWESRWMGFLTLITGVILMDYEMDSVVLLLVVSLSIFFASCFIYSVNKTRRFYTENKGFWLFCYLPVKIRMPSCCSYIWWRPPPPPPAVKPHNFVAMYFFRKFWGLSLTFAGRSAFMFVTRCFCFCFKCLWSYQAHLTHLLDDWPCRINVIDKGRVWVLWQRSQSKPWA
jgi:hypothetical protein